MSGVVGPTIRSLVAGEWAARAQAEREAELRFRDLSGRLRAHGALPEVVTMATIAADDEARHAALCVEMVTYLGEQSHEHAVEIRSFGPRNLDERDRMLYEVVSFCCINESINAALLTVSLQRATDKRIAEAARAILRDEVNHARLGWAHLLSEREHGRGQFLARAIPTMLAGAVRRDELAHAAQVSRDRDSEAAALGYVPMKQRLELFVATLRDVIFPGLEHAGLDSRAGATWLASYLQNSGHERSGDSVPSARTSRTGTRPEAPEPTEL